jgi:hypothetical protein
MRLKLYSARYFLLTVLALTAAVALCRAQDDDPPSQTGRLSVAMGTVSFQQSGTDQWSAATPNLPLGPGDRIFTDADGRAEIQIGRSYLRIAPSSDVTLVEATPTSIAFGVAQGSVHLHSLGLWEGQLLYINTPNGSAGLASMAESRADVVPGQDTTVFTIYAGNAQITGAGGLNQPLYPGQSLALAGTNPVVPQWLAPAPSDELDRWSRGRDGMLQRANFRYVSPEISGAEDLDTYGTWQPGTEYGAVWFPNDVPPGWAPYRYGHWINRAPWGWVWVEDEPWGYAPFHYGRWVNYYGRWGWIPGPPAERPVWSPALVVFAGGLHFGTGDSRVAAWFPLGPGEPYHPPYRCSPRYLDQVNRSNIQPAPRVQVQNTYVDVNRVTNVTYVNQTNITVVKGDDMASGRSVHQNVIAMRPDQMHHIQPMGAPAVQPPAHPIMMQPPARPVPVATMRPSVINASGKMITGAPGAKPIDVPVKAAPPIRPLPGRTVIAAPPAGQPGKPGATHAFGVAGQPAKPGAANSTTPAAHPGKPGAPATSTPTTQPSKPGAFSTSTPAAQPGKPGANATSTPTAQPSKPGAFTATPTTQPSKPAAPTQPGKTSAPATLPTKPATPAAQPASKPVAQPAKPVTPAAQSSKPAAPATQPVSKPVAQPAKPAAPAAQPARPTAPAQPAAKLAPKTNDKAKPADKKKDDKKSGK